MTLGSPGAVAGALYITSGEVRINTTLFLRASAEVGEHALSGIVGTPPAVLCAAVGAGPCGDVWVDTTMRESFDLGVPLAYPLGWVRGRYDAVCCRLASLLEEPSDEWRGHLRQVPLVRTPSRCSMICFVTL